MSNEKYTPSIEITAILENMSDGIIVVDMSGKIIYVNPAHGKMTGLTKKDVVGKLALEVASRTIKADDFYIFSQKFKSALAGETVPMVTATYIRGDGSEIPICLTPSFIREADGNPIASIAVVKDVSDLKKAEDALIKSEERYRTLVENASDIVFRTDNFGHFTFGNPAALRITGYREEELKGKHYRKLIRPDMLDESIKLLVSQYENRVPNTYHEFPIITKDGNEKWLGQNTQLIVEDGNVVGFQAVARDITERKQAELEREKLLSELQQALAEIKTLRGFLPICSYCKKIRDDKGYWNQLESYISKHSEALFSHSICPDCFEKEASKMMDEASKIMKENGDKNSRS